MGSLVTSYLDLIIGTIFIFIIGFFVLEIVLAGITLATSYEESKKPLQDASKQLTGAIKGLLLSLVTYFLLNTLLAVFGVTTSTENITTTLGNQFDNLMECFRDFTQCSAN